MIILLHHIININQVGIKKKKNSTKRYYSFIYRKSGYALVDISAFH